MRCIFCGREITDYVNNPAPVENTGRCCNECNISIVIPARIKDLDIHWRFNNERNN